MVILRYISTFTPFFVYLIMPTNVCITAQIPFGEKGLFLTPLYCVFVGPNGT